MVQRCVLVCLLALGLAGQAQAADTLGGVRLTAKQAGYRITLDGRVAKAALPAVTSGAPYGTSPDGRYRVEAGSGGVVLVDSRTGRRRLLARNRGMGVWWSAQGRLAFGDRVDEIDRLEVVDVPFGRRRTVARRLCLVPESPWSPDGTKLAVAISQHGRRPCAGQLTAVVDVPSGRLRRVTRPGIVPLGWTRDGRDVLVADGNDPPSLLDVATRRLRPVLGEFPNLDSVIWSPDGRRALIVAGDRRVIVVDGSLTRVLVDVDAAQSSAWSPRGDRIAIADAGGVRIYDAAKGRVLTTVRAHTARGLMVTAIVWSADGRSFRLAAAANPPPLGHD